MILLFLFLSLFFFFEADSCKMLATAVQRDSGIAVAERGSKA